MYQQLFCKIDGHSGRAVLQNQLLPEQLSGKYCDACVLNYEISRNIFLFLNINDFKYKLLR